MILLLMLAVVFWISTGIAAAGFHNAFFQRNWPSISKDSDVYSGLAVGIFGGPITLFVVYCTCDMCKLVWSLKKNAVRDEDWERAAVDYHMSAAQMREYNKRIYRS